VKISVESADGKLSSLIIHSAAQVGFDLLLALLAHGGVLSLYRCFALIEHVDFILQTFAAVVNFPLLICMLFLQLVKPCMQFFLCILEFALLFLDPDDECLSHLLLLLLQVGDVLLSLQLVRLRQTACV